MNNGLKNFIKNILSGWWMEISSWFGIGVIKANSLSGWIHEIIGKILVFFFLDQKTRNIVAGLRLLRSSKSDNKAFNKRYNRLKKEIAEIPAEKWSYLKWQILSTFFIFNSFFSLAYICRQKSKEKLYRSKNISYKKILAYVEDDELDKALVCVQKYQTGIRGRFLNDELVLLYNFIKTVLGDSNSFPTDKNFFSYVSGKKIAIFGPTITMEEFACSDIVKNVDIVIRNNSKESDNLKGHLINISYCNGECFLRLVDNDLIHSYLRSFDWVGVKYRQKLIDKYENVHRAPNVDVMLYAGTANVLPIIVSDLLLNNIHSLYICGNNLYLSNCVHSKDYIDPFVSKEELRYSFVRHDLFSQHAFLKLLYNRSIFEADKELDYVLSMSTMEYAEKMENYYF